MICAPRRPLERALTPTVVPLQRDSDNDGVADDVDLCPASKAGFPVDATGCLDETACRGRLGRRRRLRMPRMGGRQTAADRPNWGRLPLDATQWNDTDGDGYGDNVSGNQGDACPTERNLPASLPTTSTISDAR